MQGSHPAEFVGFRTEKELRDNGAKYIARKPADILEIMSK